MKKILSWIVTPLHFIVFIVILLFFHLPLVISRRVFGKKAFDKVLALQNLAHLINIRLAGTKITINHREEIPEGAPLIIVSNHQSMYDIPLVIWTFRKLRPKFIAKAELQRFIPTISFSLRHGEHLIIDRSDPSSALTLIEKYTDKILSEKFAVCIFPEGTRAKDGVLKPFKVRGLRLLLEKLSSGYVLPIAVDGSWRLLKNKLLPIPFGEKLTLSVLPIKKISDYSETELVTLLEKEIGAEVNRLQTLSQRLPDKLDKEKSISESLSPSD